MSWRLKPRSSVSGEPQIAAIFDIRTSQMNGLNNSAGILTKKLTCSLITVAGQRRICTELSPLRLMADTHQNRAITFNVPRLTLARET